MQKLLVATLHSREYTWASQSLSCWNEVNAQTCIKETVCVQYEKTFITGYFIVYFLLVPRLKQNSPNIWNLEQGMHRNIVQVQFSTYDSRFLLEKHILTCLRL